jgi:hypothetical protein
MLAVEGYSKMAGSSSLIEKTGMLGWGRGGRTRRRPIRQGRPSLLGCVAIKCRGKIVGVGKRHG